MKKTFKSMLYIMLAVLMVLGSCGIVFADTKAKIDVSIVDVSEEIAEGVNKLVFKATTPKGSAGVGLTGVVFSYDASVIQPVRHANGTNIEITTTTTNTVLGRVFLPFMSDYDEFSFAPFQVMEANGRIAIKVDTYIAGAAIDATNGMVFTEFFYKVKEGKTVTADTFKIETDYTDGSFLKMAYNDQNTAAAIVIGDNYKYGWAKTGVEDTAELASFPVFEDAPVPTEAPTITPTDEPVEPDVPTDEPTTAPTEEPPVVEPEVDPTDEPVVVPTDEPVDEPTTAPTAEAPEYTGPAVVNIYEEVVDEAQGINKLVFSAQTPNAITVTGLVFSYDESVIQPVNKTTYSNISIAPGATDTIIRRAFCAYSSEDYEFAFAPFNVIRQNGRIAIKVDTYISGATVNFFEETVFTEFYFKIKDGIAPNYETFKLETEYDDGTILKSMYPVAADAAAVILGTDYKYGTPEGEDTLELESFTFNGWDNYEEIIPPATEAPTEEPPIVEPDEPTDEPTDEPVEPDVPPEEPTVEPVEAATVDVRAKMFDPDKGSKMLEFTITTPPDGEPVNFTSVVFSYDNAVIQPVRYSNGAEVSITPTSSDSNLKRVFEAYSDDDYEFSFAPFKVLERDGRTIIKADTYCVDTSIDASNGMVFTKFYYKVKEGQTVTEDTFRLETEYSENSALKEVYPDKNEAAAISIGTYKYGWAKEGAEDTAYLNSFPTEDAEPAWYDISEFIDALDYQYVNYNRAEQYYELPEMPEVPDASLTTTVTYLDEDGNETTAPKNAGVYDVIINFSSTNPNYYTPDYVTTAFIIEKIDAVIAADAIQEFVYDGTEKTVAAQILEGDEGVELIIETATDIGEYDVAVIYPESANYYETYKYVRLNILKPTVPISAVSEIPVVTVDYGTTFTVSKSKLVNSVEVELENGESEIVNIIWRENSTPEYDEIAPGTYAFTGEFDLDPEGLIINPYNLVATAQIVVEEPTIIKNMYVSSDTGIIDESIDVIISVEGNPEMASGSFVIEYDPESLTPEAYSSFGLLPGLMVNLDYDYGKIMVSFAGTSEIAKGGDAIKLSFYVSTWNEDKEETDILIKDAKIYNGEEKRIKIIGNEGTIIARQLILGDVTDDGTVDILDAYRVLVYDAGLLTADFSKVQNRAADVNHDGCIDIFDAMRIQRYVTGFIGTLE